MEREEKRAIRVKALVNEEDFAFCKCYRRKRLTRNVLQLPPSRRLLKK